MVVPPKVAALVLAVVLVLTSCSGDSTPSAAPTTSGSASSAAAPASASASRALRVLVSNDDGVGAPGIDALVRALTAEQAIQVTVVAPVANQSGTGGKTSPGPLTATKATTASGYPATAVDGFPADAVVYGLHNVLTSPPDLVITGVNAGPNLGPVVDISGTVGAARAAAKEGIPALAVSAGFGDVIDFTSGAGAAITWLRDHRDALEASHGPATTVSNLNVPSCAAGSSIRGQVEVAPDASASTALAIAPADCTSTEPAPATDVAAFHDGFTTLSEIGLQPAS